ncbi:MAG: hypothetical protein ACO38B_05430 [Burkholderiaceae bacterium]
MTLEPRTLEELSRERQNTHVQHEEPPEGGALSILNPPQAPPTPEVPTESSASAIPRPSLWGRVLPVLQVVRGTGRNGLIAAGALTFFAGLVLMSDSVRSGYQALIEAITPPPEQMTVLVTLKNECPYADEAFMVQVLPDGPSAEFLQKRARVKAFEGQKLQVVANSRYPGFHYESKWELAAPELTLVANCDSPEERLKATAEALRQGFKK